MKIIGACICLLICAFWAGLEWAFTWSIDERPIRSAEKRALTEREIDRILEIAEEHAERNHADCLNE